ncbi:hypothetical protein AAZV13_01G107500 [Glycine max]
MALVFFLAIFFKERQQRYVEQRVDCMMHEGLLNEDYDIYNLNAVYTRDGLHKHFHLNFIGGSKALEIVVQQTKSSRVAIPVSRQKGETTRES